MFLKAPNRSNACGCAIFTRILNMTIQRFNPRYASYYIQTNTLIIVFTACMQCSVVVYVKRNRAERGSQVSTGARMEHLHIFVIF